MISGAKAMSFIKEKAGAMDDNAGLTPEDNLRLHRAHRIVWIIGGEGAHSPCFQMDQLSTEYANKYLGR